ncbi:MAG: PEP-CTERM sorting domain-containing protein, partial [Cyanobacteria bacterium P01_A01_bin.68]
LALGQNLLVAFMPWNGYNFEDSGIRFKFIGKSKQSSVGLAFDNFSARSAGPNFAKAVPEPASILGMLAFGIAGGSSILKKK